MLSWNFIGRSHEEIEEARQAWAEGSRFGEVHGYDGDRLSAPELSPVALKPRDGCADLERCVLRRFLPRALAASPAVPAGDAVVPPVGRFLWRSAVARVGTCDQV